MQTIAQNAKTSLKDSCLSLSTIDAEQDISTASHATCMSKQISPLPLSTWNFQEEQKEGTLFGQKDTIRSNGIKPKQKNSENGLNSGVFKKIYSKHLQLFKEFAVENMMAKKRTNRLKMREMQVNRDNIVTQVMMTQNKLLKVMKRLNIKKVSMIPFSEKLDKTTKRAQKEYMVDQIPLLNENLIKIARKLQKSRSRPKIRNPLKLKRKIMREDAQGGTFSVFQDEEDFSCEKKEGRKVMDTSGHFLTSLDKSESSMLRKRVPEKA